MILFKKYFHTSTHQKSSLYMQNVMKPLYIMASLVGLFPYSVIFVKNKQTFTIMRKSIYVNSLCGITICLIIFAFTGLHVKEMLSVDENINLTEAIMTQMNYIVEIIALFIFCVVAYVYAFLNRKKYVKILKQIISTWYELPPNDNNQHILTYLQFQVNVICMTTMVVVVIAQACVNFTRDNSLWKIVLVSFTFNLSQIVQFISLSFYYMLVLMVVALLMNIESHCRSYLKDNVIVADDLILIQNRTKLTLRQIKLIYIKAYEIKCNINEAFQGLILVTALQCFHSMVSESHMIYHGLFVKTSITTHEILNCIIWIIYQIIKIYFIAHSGNLVKVHAMKIGQILHNIPTEKRDSRWLLEIQNFSSLMYYQDIELNVYGYFPLNATLVSNMLASTTMYLIILVQFDKRD